MHTAMNPFEFKNLSTHTLVLTEEDNPVISVEDDKLILKAFRDNTGLIIVFPASVLVNYKSKKTRETTKPKQQRQQSKQRPVRIVTRTTFSNRGAPGKKRYPYNVGEFNPQHKLTTDDVVEIKRMLSCEEFGAKYESRLQLFREIASAYKVSPSHIYSIARGQRWCHIEV